MNRIRLSWVIPAVVAWVSPGLKSPVAAQEPATLAEIRDSVDWAKLPQLPGAKDARHRLASSTYKAPGSFADAAAFFRKTLPPVGWVEDPVPVPGVDQKDSLYVVFQKGSIPLAVTGYRSEPTALMTVVLSLGGNVDVRKFPKPADAKTMTDQRTVTMYTTAAAPEAAARFCAKRVLDKGWREVPADSAKFFAKEGRVVLRLLKNGMEIGIVAAKEKDGLTQVTCHASVRQTFEPADVRAALTAKDMPTPPGVNDYIAVLDLREFPLMPNARKKDRQTGAIALSTGISCQVPTTLDEFVAFHRKEFAARGWTETEVDTDIPGRVELTFEKSGYRVTAGAYRPDGKKDAEIGIINSGNVDLRQMPYPPGAEIRAERDTTVNATTTLNGTAAAEFYRTELGKLGWKEEKGRKGRGTLEFARNAAVLRVSVGTDTEDRTSIQLSQALLGVE